MFIQTEHTPNPEVLKFLPGREVMGEGSREFRTAQEAGASALAESLFAIDGVVRVFFGPDFVTVTKAGPAVDWGHLKAPVLAAVMDHYTSGAPLFAGDDGDSAVSHDSEVYEGETAQVVAEDDGQPEQAPFMCSHSTPVSGSKRLNRMSPPSCATAGRMRVSSRSLISATIWAVSPS